MGWNGNTYTPDTTTAHSYTVGTFAAPKKGIYRFTLKGSGGRLRNDWSTRGTPGKGGLTTGYLMLEAGQVVYVGAGGASSAAFVSKSTGASLKNIAKGDLYFVAGGGGGNGNGDSGLGSDGGDGGGTTGENGVVYAGYTGYGGTQTAGGQGNGGYGNEYQGAYGAGGIGHYGNDGISKWGGDGGDGYYGGGSGGLLNGGGGGSGYVHTESMVVGGKAYENVTQQGGGAEPNAAGSVVVDFYGGGALPIIFNGTAIEQLIYNGVVVESCIYDGVKLF